MQSRTMKALRFTRAQLRDLQTDLERELARFEPGDERTHTYAEALRRLGDGTYGTCFDCGNGISYDRLAVMPETLYCVLCGWRSSLHAMSHASGSTGR